MLSRTADHIYWMSRYLERAENTVRLLEVCYQTTLMTNDEDHSDYSWRSVLTTLEALEQYEAECGAVSADRVIDFVVNSKNYASSIASCIRMARENVRAIRGTVTSEVWETINFTWLEMNRLLKSPVLANNPTRFFEWIKTRSLQTLGAQEGTMLRNETYNFMRLGTYLERADNTARMLEIRFYLENAADDKRKLVTQLYHWTAVLRSLSGLEIYRQVFRETVDPKRVIELIVLHPDMPHSLAHSSRDLLTHLQKVRNVKSDETLRLAGRLDADLRYTTIDEIFKVGLHDWLTRYMEKLEVIGQGINDDFLWQQVQ